MSLSKVSSLSTKVINSLLVYFKPKFLALDTPPFFLLITSIRESIFLILTSIDSVLSVEPSLTTMICKSLYV